MDVNLKDIFAMCVCIFFIGSIAGCRVDSTPRIEGRVIPSPTRAEDERIRAFLHQLENGSNASELEYQFAKIVRTSSPYCVAHLFIVKCSRILNREGDTQLATRMIRVCLENKDPMIRWSGIIAAEAIGDERTAKRALEDDYASLAVRPDPQPWYAARWWSDEGSWFNRIQASALLEGLRARLLEMLGLYCITPSRALLSAVLEDHQEYSESVKDTARQALLRLDKCEGGSEKDGQQEGKK